MAIELEIPDATAITPAKITRRTWRVQLESTADQPQSNWWCIGHREEAKYNAANELLEVNKNPVRPSTRPRTAAQIATQEFTAAGATVTGAQLLALVALAFDTFDQEDEAAATQQNLPSP